MLEPSINKLVEEKGNRYKLCSAVSTRARKLLEGAEPMIETELLKPVSIAISELDEDAFEIVEPVDSPEEESF